jgi:CheY-like chemotaxis protein
MLHGARVLVVEDEFFVAISLVTEIESAGGVVVGPYNSVAAAVRAVESADVSAAILDANLIDRDVTPVAMLLAARNVPIVLHTGIGMPAELKRVHPSLRVILKPTPPAEVLCALEHEMARKVTASFEPAE